MFALTLVLWPVAALVRRHHGRTLDLSRDERRLRIAVRVACAAGVAVCAAWAAFFAAGLRDLAVFGSGSNGRVHALQAVTAVVAIACLAGVHHAYRWWRRPRASLGARILETVVALACVGFVWLVLRHHLLDYGPSF